MIFPLSSMASLTSILSVYAFLISTSKFSLVDATPISISSTLGTVTIDSTATGQSTIDVNYVLDGSSLGPSTDNTKDFYVLQHLNGGATGEDCTTALAATFTGLNGATEPAISGASQTTTTLVNTADWPRGDNKFCLRMQLMLQMSDGNDQLWHQVDFVVTVTVSFADGSTAVTYDGTSVGEDMTFESDGSGTGTGADTGVAPTFTTAIVGTSFAYGDSIPIEVGFEHPLNVFTYTVDAAGVIPVSDPVAGTPLTIGGNAVVLKDKVFTPGFNFATGAIGTLTFTLPLSVYKDTTISSVMVRIPVSWVNNARRNLRTLEGETTSAATGRYTGPPSGVTNEMVEIELEPYTDESGAIVGFTVTSVVSGVCLGATALLL
mmetsp:Transcript_19205/g.55091  ORF Transcript_19205/g.55091 Transcript_19205/m.55091 type:complete len:377 (+) Transcript_19205:326-1456(+)|eukprot:CAMPEP_0170333438 /NCGR_PEP_ID=MMETSP0116_2-20130129/67742_1 /TAXON_ID=400756 /ORGANISM="Durinskia baltica, Strain CSIRO CS-38" /LENGTH=376 /DNA_ID=CAMNT_0010586787 /DNA_START=464 /DNA_END=1594 /DNA_ORIENTATION=+